MGRVRLVVEYDGAEFAGWQAQDGLRTVQHELQTALQRLLDLPDPVPVQAAGRTDAGVHAEAQVVVLDSEVARPLSAYVKGLGQLLPPDISVLSAEEVADDFDPRRHADGKRYRYRIWNGAWRSPLRRGRWTWILKPLDVAAMRQASPALVGEHDFASFRGQGCQARTTVRTLTRVEILGESRGEVQVLIEGHAFLRYMVRNIVGTLIEIGHGRLAPGALAGVLRAADRTAAGPTAPAEGLTLEAVYYGHRMPPSP